MALSVNKNMKRTLQTLAAAFILLAIISVAFGFFIFKKYSENLPDYEQLKKYTPSVTTRIYAADGSLVNEFSKEKRVFVPIESIPKNLVNAFLAAEDSNFYDHLGIDPLAILRTAVRNLLSKMEGKQVLGGASTITQQVVKNLLLTNERTLQRKIKEAILAFRMTKSFTKDQVLELYLNQIYLGSSSYGVAVAAETYFNKSIDQLTIEENALLATLPKAPSKLDPRKDIKKSKIRRDWVIKRMLSEGFISSQEAELAIKTPIILGMKESNQINKAEFFSDSVKKELTGLYGSDNVFESGIVVRTTLDNRLQKIASSALSAGIEKYDMKHGYRGALKKFKNLDDWKKKLKKFKITRFHKADWHKAVILSLSKYSAKVGVENGELGSIEIDKVMWAKKYISVDETGPKITKMSDIFSVGDVILVEKVIKVQKSEEIAEETPDEGNKYLLRQIPKVNGAFIAMDPHTGRVLAMMGGYIDAANQFNRATQAIRQPGSTLKPFGYIAALENGMTPATIIMDEEITLNQGDDLPPYKPSNYSGRFYGPTTLRVGLEKSRNVTTVRMIDQIGIDKLVDVVKRFGINSNPKEIYSLVLGSTESSLMRVVTAYAMMVNGGNKISPSMIEKIQDRDGMTIYRRDERNCKSCSPEESVESGDAPVPFLRDTRKEITDSATAYQITSMLQGTVEKGTGRRATAIRKIIAGKTGTTNNSYDSWFVGFTPDLVAGVYIGFDLPKTLGAKETGSSVALPIFVDFMGKALSETPSTPFRVPSSVKFVKIDRDTGSFPTSATTKDKIFFEALKLEDTIEDSGTEENGEFGEFEEGNSNADPAGIY